MVSFPSIYYLFHLRRGWKGKLGVDGKLGGSCGIMLRKVADAASIRPVVQELQSCSFLRGGWMVNWVARVMNGLRLHQIFQWSL